MKHYWIALQTGIVKEFDSEKEHDASMDIIMEGVLLGLVKEEDVIEDAGSEG